MKKKKKKDIIAHRNFEKLHRFDFSKLTLFSSKVIHGWFILLLIFLSLLFCGKSPQKIITLPEISPDGGGALSSKQEKISPSIGMITEIEEVGGVQKYIYIKLGKKNRRLKKGLLGYIYNDLAMKEKIGKFELIQVFRNFSKGKIIELNYKIDTKAIVAIEVDPRYLIK